MSALVRAAASSTASGRLSRRAQSSAISSLGSSPERSQKSATASGGRAGAPGTRPPRARAGARASDEQGEVGAGLEQRGELGRGLDDLLQVVEQEQQLPLADVFGEAVLDPERLRDRLGDERRVAKRGEPDPEDACLVLGNERGGRLEREPRLARAARAGEREEPRSLSTFAASRRARARGPTKELAGRGRFVFEIVLSGGNVPSPSWKMATASSMSLKRCSPRSTSANRRPRSRGRLRDDDLAAVGTARRRGHRSGRPRQRSPPR